MLRCTISLQRLLLWRQKCYWSSMRTFRVLCRYLVNWEIIQFEFGGYWTKLRKTFACCSPHLNESRVWITECLTRELNQIPQEINSARSGKILGLRTRIRLVCYHIRRWWMPEDDAWIFLIYWSRHTVVQFKFLGRYLDREEPHAQNDNRLRTTKSTLTQGRHLSNVQKDPRQNEALPQEMSLFDNNARLRCCAWRQSTIGQNPREENKILRSDDHFVRLGRSKLHLVPHPAQLYVIWKFPAKVNNFVVWLSSTSSSLCSWVFMTSNEMIEVNRRVTGIGLQKAWPMISTAKMHLDSDLHSDLYFYDS